MQGYQLDTHYELYVASPARYKHWPGTIQNHILQWVDHYFNCDHQSWYCLESNWFRLQQDQKIQKGLGNMDLLLGAKWWIWNLGSE